MFTAQLDVEKKTENLWRYTCPKCKQFFGIELYQKNFMSTFEFLILLWEQNSTIIGVAVKILYKKEESRNTWIYGFDKNKNNENVFFSVVLVGIDVMISF